MIDLNDPYCQQFIEAMASIMVYLSQQELSPSVSERAEKVSRTPVDWPPGRPLPVSLGEK